VLASRRGGRDADDLAGTALKDEEVTEADVVSGNCDSVGGFRRGGRTAGGGDAAWSCFASCGDNVNFLTL